MTEPEWPPHPSRLVAALVAAAHGRGDRVDRAREAIGELCEADPPIIVAPRLAPSLDTGEQADGLALVASLRGASRWAPRNHELSELSKGLSPRDLGRSRAEIHKPSVAIGDQEIAFIWSDVTLGGQALADLQAAAEDVTFLGTARSPVLLTVAQSDVPSPRSGWLPFVERDSVAGVVDVRVPERTTLIALDRWHERRRRPLAKDGFPMSAPYVPPATIGRSVAYGHSDDVPPRSTVFDPRHWGDVLVLALDRESSDAIPKGPAAFAVTRATRKALLSTYDAEGTPGQAPPVLRARGDEGHAAFVPLSFVAVDGDAGPGANHADGHLLGVALVLPHVSRVSDVVRQRLDVERGLRALCIGHGDQGPIGVRVPGVGVIFLRPLSPATRPPVALTEQRYRSPSRCWTTVTPLVHSRYLPRRGEDALLDQAARECRDVGLPAPVRIRVRGRSRVRGGPDQIGRRALPPDWTGPLRGPQAHLDLWFDEPVVGPVILGRARHFGLGLCLPFAESESSRPAA